MHIGTYKKRHIQIVQNSEANIIPLQKHIIAPWLKIHPLLLTSPPLQRAAHLDLASSGNFLCGPDAAQPFEE